MIGTALLMAQGLMLTTPTSTPGQAPTQLLPQGFITAALLFGARKTAIVTSLSSGMPTQVLGMSTLLLSELETLDGQETDGKVVYEKFVKLIFYL